MKLFSMPKKYGNLSNKYHLPSALRDQVVMTSSICRVSLAGALQIDEKHYMHAEQFLLWKSCVGNWIIINMFSFIHISPCDFILCSFKIQTIKKLELRTELMRWRNQNKRETKKIKMRITWDFFGEFDDSKLLTFGALCPLQAPTARLSVAKSKGWGIV